MKFRAKSQDELLANTRGHHTSFDRKLLDENILSYAFVALAGILLFLPSIPKFSTEYLGHPACDMNIAYRHYLTFGASSLRRGIIPEWNPYIFCGTPFLPSTCATLHQPLNAICFALFPLPLAANLLIVFHVAVLGLGICYWGRVLGFRPWISALAGILALGSSAVVGRVFAGHFTLLCSLAWTPWLFAAVHSAVRSHDRRVASVALFTALVLLGGHLQIAYYAFLLSIIIFVAANFEEVPKRNRWLHVKWRVLLLAVGGILGAALAAVELGPVLDALHLSARISTPDKAWVRRFSLPYENLLTLTFPNLWGAGLDYLGKWFWWEVSPFCGVSVLLLAVAALFSSQRDRKVLTVPVSVCIVSAMLAVASDLPVLDSLVRFLPGWTALRGHGKIFSFALLTLPLVAARGIDSVLEKDRRTTLALVVMGAILLGSALIVMTGLVDRSLLAYLSADKTLSDRLFGLSPFTADGQKLAVASAFRAALHTLCITCLLLGATYGTWRTLIPPLVAKRFLSLLCIGELAVLALPVANHHFPPKEIPELRQLAKLFESTQEHVRVELIPDGLVNASMSYRLSTPGGNDINVMEPYDTFLAAIDGKPSGEPHLHVRVEHESPLWDFAALRYLVIPSDQQVRAESGLRKAFELGNFVVWERPSALPYAWLVGDARWIANDEKSIREQLEHLATTRSQQVWLIGPKHELPQTTQADDQHVSATRVTLTKIILTPPSSGLVFVAEGYSPHWRARDAAGSPLQVYRANSAFMAIEVPNPTTVTLTYENPWFFWGRLLSTIAVVIFLAVVAYETRQHRRARQASH